MLLGLVFFLDAFNMVCTQTVSQQHLHSRPAAVRGRSSHGVRRLLQFDFQGASATSVGVQVGNDGGSGQGIFGLDIGVDTSSPPLPPSAPSR
ncbi:hypothetical protein WJX73_002442 [Symbiochloris irregularis]|uniref:Secreted protein n=1 Tax=Symbiochloris irregularis TaxID=706552 RepID=A0AAW1P5H7_9CHLO